MGTGAEQPGCHKLSARLITGVRNSIRRRGLRRIQRLTPVLFVNARICASREHIRPVASAR
jgi:hypothetical protein